LRSAHHSVLNTSPVILAAASSCIAGMACEEVPGIIGAGARSRRQEADNAGLQ
jgi:hypothetical protein